MRPTTLSGIAAVALMLSACQTLDSPQAIANADAQRDECKVVTLTSATQITHGGEPARSDARGAQQAEGVLEAGSLGLREPRLLANPGAPHDSVIARAARNC